MESQKNGIELIFQASGEPYGNESSAVRAISQKKLNPDHYKVIPVKKENGSNGFAIVSVAGLPEPPEQPKAPKQKENYHRVRFHSKSNPNDTNDVQLSVNSETLLIQREVEVVLPDRFLECADHTTYPIFRQLPNQPRKIVSWVKTYPYDRLGEGTEEEFKKTKAQGTKVTKENIEKYGYDYEQEE